MLNTLPVFGNNFGQNHEFGNPDLQTQGSGTNPGGSYGGKGILSSDLPDAMVVYFLIFVLSK